MGEIGLERKVLVKKKRSSRVLKSACLESVVQNELGYNKLASHKAFGSNSKPKSRYPLAVGEKEARFYACY